jgi:hypothetical protein
MGGRMPAENGRHGNAVWLRISGEGSSVQRAEKDDVCGAREHVG